MIEMQVGCRLNSLAAAQVPLLFGRPDLTESVRSVAASRPYLEFPKGYEGSMGVWSAGPKAMNNIVYAAVGRTAGDVRLYPLAYEM